MTGKEFADLCAAQIGQCYVWGGLGYTLTETRIAQLKRIYPKVYTDAYLSKCRKNIGKKAFDCVGLIKHFLWGNYGDGVLRYYGTNGIPDTSANSMYKLCTESGNIDTLPEIPGLLLHKDGHVGVYIGGGLLIEARGVDYGVMKSSLSERNFTHWGKLPTIDYPETPAPTAKTISLAELATILQAQGITGINIQ